MNRRRILAGGTAAVAAQFLQAKSALASPMGPPSPPGAVAESLAALRRTMHPGAFRLLTNALKEQRYHGNVGVTRIVLSVTLRVLQNHPGVFDLDHVMRGPVDEIEHDGQTYVVEARTRKLAAQWHFEPMTNTQGLPVETEQAMLDMMAQEVALEIEQERKQCAPLIPCPYVGLTSGGVVIDPTTFEPVLGFLIRYGLLKPSEPAVS